MSDVIAKSIILASKSAARLAMFEAAGITLDAAAPMVDEDTIRQSMISGGDAACDIALALAQAKAVKISLKYPENLVIGSDQILETESKAIMSKAETANEAREVLKALSGETHKLHSAVTAAENGQPVWQHIDTAVMTMRELSSEFINDYVTRYWEEIRPCVGCYRIEAEGAQLFTHIAGDQFTIMGMPLLPVLDYLRLRRILRS